jgi:hypothetical protein
MQQRSGILQLLGHKCIIVPTNAGTVTIILSWFIQRRYGRSYLALPAVQ